MEQIDPFKTNLFLNIGMLLCHYNFWGIIISKQRVQNLSYKSIINGLKGFSNMKISESETNCY